MRDIRPFETIAVGKYRFRTGMGLVLGNSFGIGKTAALSGLSRSGAVIRGHSSRSEAGYFRGAAATARLSRRIKAGVFVSHRPMDATLNADGTAATIITSGYHRRPEEIAKKNNTHAAAAGLTAAYSADGIHVGATAVYTRLDRQLRPKTGAVFRQYYAAGSNFVNLGLDYGYIAGALAFRGETATDRHGAIATINTVGVTVAGGLSLTAVQRFYSYRYTSLYAGGFSDGGSIRNESGLYLAADWNISRRMSLSAYTDFAYFPWPRYRVSGSSKSADNMLSASYKAGAWTVGGRYRLRLRERDNEQRRLSFRVQSIGRVSVRYMPSRQDTGTVPHRPIFLRPAETMSVGGGCFRDVWGTGGLVSVSVFRRHILIPTTTTAVSICMRAEYCTRSVSRLFMAMGCTVRCLPRRPYGVA